jgi:hypothetical protein
VFVGAMMCLLAGTFYYIHQVTLALSSVREEASDPRFGVPPDIGGHRTI